MPIVKCAHCGKEIKNGNKSFCNKKCRDNYRKEKKGNCPYCNKEVNNSQKIYCSKKCYFLHKKELRINKWLNGEWDGCNGVKTKSLSPSVREYLIIKSENRCSICGIYDWNNRDITLEIDHIDGNYLNNSPENLRVLCPNCHSQTSNYKSKNKGSGRPYFKNNHR